MIECCGDNERATKLLSSVIAGKARRSVASGDNPGIAGRGACVEVILTRPVMAQLRQRLVETDQRLLEVFEQLEAPCELLTAAMEMTGIGLEPSTLEKLRRRMQTRLIELEAEAQEAAGGRRFALSSTEEVAKVLFKDLRLPPDPDHVRRIHGRVTCPTNKTVLSKLSRLHPLPDIIMQWRKLSSALTKSLLGVHSAATSLPQPPFRGQQTSRVFFECALIATGRIAVVRPALQLVPKDIQEVDKGQLTLEEDDDVDSTDATLAKFSLRQMFVAAPGCLLLTVDYSQIELRIIAHLSGDSALLTALQDSSSDVFRRLTAEWSGVNVDQVTDEQRANTKQLVYAMLYGIGTKSLASVCFVLFPLFFFINFCSPCLFSRA